MGCLKLTYYQQYKALELNRNFSKGALEKNGYAEKKRVSSSTFGFQGQEKDDEVNLHTGSSYTAQFWQYDPRLGRRWNVDPITKSWESPYAAFSNNPIYYTDPLGLDSDPVMLNEATVKDRGTPAGKMPVRVPTSIKTPSSPDGTSAGKINPSPAQVKRFNQAVVNIVHNMRPEIIAVNLMADFDAYLKSYGHLGNMMGNTIYSSRKEETNKVGFDFVKTNAQGVGSALSNKNGESYGTMNVDFVPGTLAGGVQSAMHGNTTQTAYEVALMSNQTHDKSKELYNSVTGGSESQTKLKSGSSDNIEQAVEVQTVILHYKDSPESSLLRATGKVPMTKYNKRIINGKDTISASEEKRLDYSGTK